MEAQRCGLSVRVVRPEGDGDMIRRVVLTGSESVGKTTLARELADHFDVLVAHEFVRDYALQKGAPLAYSDHGAIADGQMAREDAAQAAARARGDDLLVYDTDLVSTVAYHHHYYGQCPAYIEERARARLADQYLLLDIDVPWVADGVRDRELHRAEVHAQFVDTLNRLGARFTVIHGSWESRLAHAIRIIDAVRMQQ